MVSGAVRELRQSGRRGSSLSDRQIMYSVRHGQPVTAILGPYVTVVGYVFGLDDYHLAIVSPAVDRYLVHKRASLMFGSEGVYDLEPRREELEPLVGPFRRWIERSFSGANTTTDGPG